MGKRSNRKYTKLRAAYDNMIRRCYTPQNSHYPHYGGRGITVCEDWLLGGFDVFEKWALANGYRDGLSIDRIDVNASYSPENCRWADRITQANNTTKNRHITYKGETKTLADWERTLGLYAGCISARLARGWSEEKAVTVPQAKHGVAFDGRTQSVRQWAKETGIPVPTIYYRLSHGWTVEEALTNPPSKKQLQQKGRLD